MQFVAIDVETANAEMASICQVGVAKFVDGQLVDEWSTLIDPEDDFDGINISIHGIEPEMVRGKPKLPEIAERLRASLSNTVSVCHTHFDRVALGRAYAKYRLEPINTAWLDSARVVRRTWKDLAWSGYGLANACSRIGYEFKHHDALEDAKAAGILLLAAMRESNLNLDGLLQRVMRPIDPTRSSSGAALHRDGNPEGDFFGEVIVFTGALELPRAQAADLAAGIGCEVAPGVTKKTTILVVGDQDVARLAGQEKSSKQRKAEELAAKGHRIRIINESGFRSLVQSAGGDAYFDTLDEFAAYHTRILESAGWTVQKEEQSLGLHRRRKNGSVLKTPDVLLAFWAYANQPIFDDDDAALAHESSLIGRWVLRAKDKPSKSFAEPAKAQLAFLEFARELSPGPES